MEYEHVLMLQEISNKLDHVINLLKEEEEEEQEEKTKNRNMENIPTQKLKK